MLSAHHGHTKQEPLLGHTRTLKLKMHTFELLPSLVIIFINIPYGVDLSVLWLDGLHCRWFCFILYKYDPYSL